MIWIVLVMFWLIIGFMVWQILAPSSWTTVRRRQIDRLLRRYRDNGTR